jgi:DNA sulfur modification protein DndB
MDASFGYTFPAIRGTQAHREYFVSMCPLRLIPRVFAFNEEEEVPPELRAQRVLNKGRLPEMTRYILSNREGYVFSAITASIDGDVDFEPILPDGGPEAQRVGVLHVDMNARFIINDGQHRRAAIEQAIKENQDLGDETIAVVFFLDRGLKRCQQMFADLNRYAVRPSSSIGVLYDHRDDRAEVVRAVALKTPVFRGLVEMERSTLTPRSRKLFTLSSIYHSTIQLIRGFDLPNEKLVELASTFWDTVGKQIPEWALVQSGKLASGEVRQEYLHSHGVMLQALGRVGNALISEDPKAWLQRLKKLRDIDWSRSNAQWEGRTMIGGRVSKADAQVQLTVNLLKQYLGLPLTPDENRSESSYKRGQPSKGREAVHA